LVSSLGRKPLIVIGQIVSTGVLRQGAGGPQIANQLTLFKRTLFLKPATLATIVADFGDNLSPKTATSQKKATVAAATVAVFGHSDRIRRQSPFSVTVWTGLYNKKTNVDSDVYQIWHTFNLAPQTAKNSPNLVFFGPQMANIGI